MSGIMTFHNFSQFIQIWLIPPGLILFLMLSGLIIWSRHHRAGKLIIIFSGICFWLLSTPVVTQFLIDALQNRYPPLQLEEFELEKRSAIVVLGCGVENAMEYESKHTVSDRTLSRLRYAAYLYSKIHLPIIVSGGNRDNRAYTEADLMLEVLKNDYKIVVKWLENKSTNTAEESKFLLPILQEHAIQKIYLVTHAWHMPRSMYIFNKVLNPEKIKIVPAPMGYILLKSDNWFSNCLPSLNALNTSAFALHEYLGLLWYHFKHFLNRNDIS